jgi:hypothetical protein
VWLLSQLGLGNLDEILKGLSIDTKQIKIGLQVKQLKVHNIERGSHLPYPLA